MVKKTKTYLILLDTRSIYNVGAIFRTADAVSVSKIYLVGTTPTPFDRFGRVRSDLHKAALGAELTVPWEYCADAKKLLTKLKKEGVEIIVIEQSPSSIDYKKYKLSKTKDRAVIVGTEVSGVSKEILAMSDSVLEIPMYGKKESLNVTVALGVVLFRILNI